MHDNKKTRGLNGSRILGYVGIFTIILKKITSRRGGARRSHSPANEPDFPAGTWETVDMMRRRMMI